MDRSSDTTTFSPMPFSPFSSAHSFGSEGGTSDEPADLGQLAAVFEVLRTEYQPRVTVQPTQVRAGTPSSSLAVSASDDEPALDDDNEEDYGSVWSQNNVVEYLASSSALDKAHHLLRPTQTDSDTEGEAEAEVDDYNDNDDEFNSREPELEEGGLDQPSLGYLDGVLGFLAAERAKLAVRPAGPSANTQGTNTRSDGPRSAGTRSAGTGGGASSTSESAWRHVVEPRRKRRRKRGKSGAASAGAGSSVNGGGAAGSGVDIEVPSAGEDIGEELAADPITPVGDQIDGSSSGPDFEYRQHGKSMPSTPPRSPKSPKAPRSRGRKKDPSASSNNQSAGGASSSSNAPGGNTTTVAVYPKLTHSRSTPLLRVSIPSPPDARVLRLRTLATKLRMLFTEDARTLSSVLLNDVPDEDGFVDTRGRPPDPDLEDGERLVHCFIDHSNILIGFLNHLRRFPVHPSRRTKTHMSHAALALILERGRPVSRRVLATSSPLYQPMDGAEKLGYEVRVYARVPDLGDGADRVAKLDRGHSERDAGMRSPRTKRNGLNSVRGGTPNSGHARKTSTGGSGAGEASASADSDPGQAPMHGNVKSHSRNSSLTNAHNLQSIVASSSSSINVLPGSSGIGAGVVHPTLHGSPHGAPMSPYSGVALPRVRYREQGVDELLQLKLHQALADADSPPSPGSTIVLATGDGNVGQFNEEGFLGCVRTALKKGWCVELYAWEVGLSKSWVKEFGNGAGKGEASSYGDRFRIVGLEPFAQDLLEIP